MTEKDRSKLQSENESGATKKFALEDFKLNPLSSAETLNAAREHADAKDENINDDLGKKLAEAIAESDDETRARNPIFKELAEPVLPAPSKENRARLQMQSPHRLHFYWSLRANPLQTLHRIFGARSKNYALVAKLVNETNGREEIYPIDAEGAWWFDVDADSSYRAEVGFYSASRPFVRLMFSNRVETPRKNPSPRAAQTADWSVSANAFAEVLDASGFAQDAFEVALAGDDFAHSETATKTAFAQMFGETRNDRFKNNSSEMRFALLALAAGYAPADLRGQISHSLFIRLQENAVGLSAEKARIALQENFDFSADENEEIEFLSPSVFGASLINFPRFSKRRFAPKFAPLSSFNLTASR